MIKYPLKYDFRCSNFTQIFTVCTGRMVDSYFDKKYFFYNFRFFRIYLVFNHLKAIIEYNQKDDELVGFCNVNTKIPKVRRFFQGNNAQFVVGNDENAYDNIVQMFEKYKIGGYARVVLLKPLHPCLPRIVALLAATCNNMVASQIQEANSSIFPVYFQYCC